MFRLIQFFILISLFGSISDLIFEDDFENIELELSQPSLAAGVQQEPVDGSDLADAAAVYEVAAGSTTFLQSGEKGLRRVDLVIPGREGLDFLLARTYRSRLHHDGAIGHGWTLNYDERLHVQPNGDVLRLDDRGHLDTWLKSGDAYIAPPGYFGMLVTDGANGFILREPDGTKRRYDSTGRLTALEDRFGSQLSLDYDPQGLLSQVTDVFGRKVDFEWAMAPDGQMRLSLVRDFIAREVLYSYDDRGDLVAVRTPVVVGTSTGNDFPGGRSEHYAYDPSSDPELAHNLLSVTRPEEVAGSPVPALQFQYGSDPFNSDQFDRIVLETVGGTNASGIAAGGDIAFVYTPMNTGAPPGQPGLPRLEVEITERNGNILVTAVAELAHLVETRRSTRGLRPGEPSQYVTTFEYDADGQLIRRIEPLGNEVRYAFDISGPRAARRNVIEIRRIADPARGGGPDLVTTFDWEPLYQQITRITDPRGDHPAFVPPIGSQSAARYTTRFFYDYQEHSATIPEAVQFGIDLSAIDRNLGDLNGDGATEQAAGRHVRVELPPVLLEPGSNEALRLGSTIQERIEEIQWNDAGQPVRNIDAEGNVHTFEYYPENDPDGDGEPVPGNGSTTAAGYVAAHAKDAETSPRRSATAPPTALTSSYGYDAVGNVVSIVNPRGIETRFELNALNEIILVTRGADVSVAAASGQLVTGEAPFEYLRRFTYDHNGRIVLREDENRDGAIPGVGAFVERNFSYDILDNLVEFSVEVDGTDTSTYQQRYDAHDLRTRLIQPEGNETRFEFDERHLLFRITRGHGSPGASTEQFDYDDNGNLACHRDAEDTDGVGGPESTCFGHDGFDRRISAIDALGNETAFTYDPASNVDRVVVMGHPADEPLDPPVLLMDRFNFLDEAHRVFRVDEELFLAVGFTPARAVVLSDEDDDGRVTTRLEYDALSRPTFSLEDDLQTTRFVYDGASRLIEQWDAMGNRFMWEYDRNSNPVMMGAIEVATDGTVPDEEFWGIFSWDQLDRLVRVSAEHTQRFEYDSHGNLIGFSDAQGPVIADPFGISPVDINDVGNSVTFEYDGRSLPVTARLDLRQEGEGGMPLDLSNPFNPDGQVTITHNYDANGRLEEMQDDSGNTTTYHYDALDRVVSVENADGTTYSYVYDADDNLTSLVDPNMSVTTHVFDALNRLLERQVTPAGQVGGTTLQTFSYDGLSRVTQTLDDNGGSAHTVTFVYDSLSRVLEESQDGEATSSQYAGDGRRLSLQYPGGRTITFEHDEIDRVASILDGGNPIASYRWIGPDFRVLDRVHGNGTRLSYLDDMGTADIGWDRFRRTIRMRHMDGSTALVDRGYEYNREDQRLRESRADDGTRTDRYTYDSLYRLHRTQYDLGGGLLRDLRESEYLLDGVTNRREVHSTRTSSGVSMTGQSVNSMNEYGQIGAFVREHDDNGNLSDDGRERIFEFDALDRIVSVKRRDDEAQIATYEYDSLGRRVRKELYDPDAPQAPPVVTRYFHDGFREIEERGASSVQATYVQGIGLDDTFQVEKTSASPAGAGTLYLHANARGDVVAVTDGAGMVLETLRYQDFGAVPAASAVGNPFAFQGRRLDPETGLYQFRQRYMDPANGRFIQRDRASDAENLGNAYTFVNHAPVTYCDPLGSLRAKICGFVIDPGQSLEFGVGVFKGIGKSLIGFGETIGGIVVGGTAQWAGADPNGYFGDAMKKADQAAEGIIAMIDDPALLVKAPAQQIMDALDRGDAGALGEVSGQIAFDLVTALEGAPSTIKNATTTTVNTVRRVRRALHGARRIEEVNTLRPIAAADRAAAKVADQSLLQQMARAFDSDFTPPSADYVVSAHGGLTTRLTDVPPNITVRAYSKAGTEISVSKGMRIEKGVETPSHIFRGGDKIPDQVFTPFATGLKKGEYMVSTGRGVFTVAEPTTLAAIMEHFSKMFPDRNICIDISACRSYTPLNLPRPVAPPGGLRPVVNRLGAPPALAGVLVQVTDEDGNVLAEDNFILPAGPTSHLDVGANDTVPPGSDFVLVNGPGLSSDLFQWNGDGTFSVSPLTFGPTSIEFTYQVINGPFISGLVEGMLTIDNNKLVDLEVQEDPDTGVAFVNVPVLVLDGEHFPAYQFILANSPGDNCVEPHWHSYTDVFSFEFPELPLSDPEPNDCGFGVLAAVPQDVVPLEYTAWLAFLVSNPPQF